MAKTKTHPGRNTRRRTTVALRHLPAPHNYWHRKLSDVRVGDERWRLTLVRDGSPTRSLDEVCEAFSWTENASHIMSGSISLRRPAFDPHNQFKLNRGDVVTCELGHLGVPTWSEIWRMSISNPQVTLTDAVHQYELTDDLVRLQKSQGNFKFSKDKAHPLGWTGDEVIRWLGKEYNFPIGRLPKMRHRIKKMTLKKSSPLSVIGKVLRAERVDTGARYFVRWENGGLSVLPFQRSKELIEIAGLIIDGTYSEAEKDNFATVLRVTQTHEVTTGTDGGGHKTKKKVHMTVVVEAPTAIERYGRVVKLVTAPKKTDTVAEMRKFARNLLSKRAVPDKTLTITMPGMPRLRRGDAMRLTIEDIALDRAIVFVKEITHDVGSGGTYTSEVTVQFEDPFVAVDKALAKKRLKCDNARKRKRKLPKGCPAETATKHRHKQPKSSKRRGQAPAGVKRHKGVTHSP